MTTDTAPGSPPEGAIAYWDTPLTDRLEHETVDAALAGILERTWPDVPPATVTLVGFRRRTVDVDALTRRILDDTLEYADEHYGDPEGSPDPPGEAVRKAARALAEAVRDDLFPWRCEPVDGTARTVDLDRWQAEHVRGMPVPGVPLPDRSRPLLGVIRETADGRLYAKLHGTHAGQLVIHDAEPAHVPPHDVNADTDSSHVVAFVYDDGQPATLFPQRMGTTARKRLLEDGENLRNLFWRLDPGAANHDRQRPAYRIEPADPALRESFGESQWHSALAAAERRHFGVFSQPPPHRVLTGRAIFFNAAAEPGGPITIRGTLNVIDPATGVPAPAAMDDITLSVTPLCPAADAVIRQLIRDHADAG